MNKKVKEKPILECENCHVPMEVEWVREDGCRMFVCPICKQNVGEETEEFFIKLRKEGLL